MLHGEWSTVKMQNEAGFFPDRYCKLKAYIQMELADRIFFLMCAWINSCRHQNRLKVFLKEHFTKPQFNRNTIHQLLWKFLPKRFSINSERPGSREKHWTHTNLQYLNYTAEFLGYQSIIFIYYNSIYRVLLYDCTVRQHEDSNYKALFSLSHLIYCISVLKVKQMRALNKRQC